MTTINDRPTEVESFKQATSRKRLLMIAAIVLAVALAALAIRTTDKQETTSRGDEIEQLLDDYLTAWETQDEAALRSATTDGYVLNEYAYTFEDVAGFRLNYHVNDNVVGVINEGFGYNWSTEHVGDSMVTGEGPWFVSIEETWQERSYIYEGQANYTIVEVDGVLRIANHYWAGLRFYQAE